MPRSRRFLRTRAFFIATVIAVTSGGASAQAALPAPTPGTLEIWFKAPLGGQTVSGVLSQGSCYVKGYSATRVAFFLDSTPLNTDSNVADGMSCVLDTRKFPNGAHQLRAMAYDAAGRSYHERINITIQNSTTAPNTPPSVSITSPMANQSVTGTLNYAANAADNAGVARVEFRLDGALIATDSSAPYSGSVPAPAAGTHMLAATAYDAAGLATTSTVSFSVPQTQTPPPNTPPTVSITSPAANQSVTGTLNYAANAADNVGVARVEFRLDGALIATDTNAPYSGSIAAPAAGSHTLTATAYDAAGLAATSAVSFSVPQAQTPPPSAACSPGATSAIAVSAVPSRVSGIAPLAVFFDGSATRASGTARPFHDLEYRWNFGDPALGATWSHGSGAGIATNNSKNAAAGPMAAHVFESAGTYTVCLTVTDGANTAARPVTITVTSPDAPPEFAGAATLCVDSRARPVPGVDGCPAGAAVLQSPDFDAAINTTARNGATHKRILFRRGSTFTSSTTAAITANGPGLVGAYGSGAKPHVNGASGKFVIGHESNLSFGDWRIVDLSLDGQAMASNGGTAFQTIGPFRQLTLLRVEARRFLHGVLLSKWFLDNRVNNSQAFRAPLWSELAIAESVIENVYDYGFLGEANRISMLGNRFLARTSSAMAQAPGHLVRLGYANGAVLSHNSFAGDSPGNSLTIRGVPNGGDRTIPPDAWTEKVVVSDNVIAGGQSAWFFTIRRVNDWTEARFRNILVERNWIIATPPTFTALVTDAGEMTIRNNLFNLTGANGQYAIMHDKTNLTPAGVNANVSIYNNTAYSGSTGYNNFRFLQISNGAPANLRVQNNLAYLPSLSGSHLIVSGTPGTGSVVSHNTDGAAMRTNPGFVGSALSGPGLWRATGSTVVDRGTPVPVRSDFFLAPRTGTYDLGAINPVPEL